MYNNRCSGMDTCIYTMIETQTSIASTGAMSPMTAASISFSGWTLPPPLDDPLAISFNTQWQCTHGSGSKSFADSALLILNIAYLIDVITPMRGCGEEGVAWCLGSGPGFNVESLVNYFHFMEPVKWWEREMSDGQDKTKLGTSPYLALVRSHVRMEGQESFVVSAISCVLT